MPYLIETYAKNKDNSLRCVNIDSNMPFDTVEAANEHIKILLSEQAADNECLMNMYADKLEAQLMDIDTEDRILRQPTLYNYTYKAKKYSNRAARKMN